MEKFNPETRIELEAAVFRRLKDHLQDHTEVQNIDLMNLAGFCRNCFSKWLVEAAKIRGLKVSLKEARRYVYGMDYKEWKEKHQTPASPEQLAAFAERQEK